MNLDQSFSILFWLHKTKINSDGMAPIYVRITIDGKRAECSTSKVIRPKGWNSKRGLPKPSYYLAKPISDYIRQTEAEIHKYYNVLLTTKEYVTADDVKRSFRGIKAPGIKVHHKSLLELLTQFIKKLEERTGKNDVSAGRCKQFKTLKAKCEQFMKHHYGIKDILLKDLKLGFMEEFYHFLRTVHTVSRCGTFRVIAQNTSMKYCKQLKQTLDLCTRLSGSYKDSLGNMKLISQYYDIKIWV